MFVATEEITQIQDDVQVSLRIVEGVLLDGVVYGVTLTLPTGSTEAQTEGRSDLPAQVQGGSRGEQFHVLHFTDGIAGTTHQLQVHVGLEFHGFVGLTGFLCLSHSHREQRGGQQHDNALCFHTFFNSLILVFFSHSPP